MELRPELLPPPVPAERLAWLCAEIERIEGLVARGGPGEADEAVAAFNTETGHNYTVADFANYWRSGDVEEFALEAARPGWPKVPDVTHDELAELVRRVMSVAPDWEYCLLLLQVNVPNPGLVDLLFPAELTDATAEEIVRVALAYRPTAL
ncbi:hypothetical protein [Streptodolium elevatio]